MEMEQEYLNVFSVYLFIEKLLSSSSGDCISRSDLSMSSSWLSGHPAPPESGPELSKATLRGVTQSPRSRFSGGAKHVMKVMAVVMLSFVGRYMEQ